MAGGDWFSELCKSNGEFDESRLVERTVELLRKYLEINDDPSFMKVNVLKVSANDHANHQILKTKIYFPLELHTTISSWTLLKTKIIR